MAIIEINGLSKRFGDHEAVQILDNLGRIHIHERPSVNTPRSLAPFGFRDRLRHYLIVAVAIGYTCRHHRI